jgi:hypothetical protein
MFFAIAALVGWLNEGGRRQLAWLAISSLLCYLSDLEAWFCFGLCAVALVVRYRRRWRSALVAGLVILPSVVLALVAFHGEPLTGRSATWHDFPTLVMEFPRNVMELFPGNIDRRVFEVLALTVIGFLCWKRTRLADETTEQRGQIGTLVFVLFAAYLLLPFQTTIPTTWTISPRLPAMMAPLFLLWPALPSQPPLRFAHRLLFLPVVLCGLVLPLQLASLYQHFNRQNVAFIRMVEHLPKGARALVVVRGVPHGARVQEVGEDGSSSGSVYCHFSAWPMALGGGYSSDVAGAEMPVVPKNKFSAPSRSDVDAFDPREAPDFDYYVVREPDENLERQPSLKVQERFGDWVLFKRIYSMTDEP